MGFRFKNRQLAYAPLVLENDAERRKRFLNSEEYVPVVILARLTEQDLTGTTYSYRVATGCGNVATIPDEELLTEAEYKEKFEESSGQPENVV